MATGRVVLKVVYSGKESSGPYRFINVWVKMQGRWQLSLGAKVQGEDGSVENKLIVTAVP